MIKIRIRAYHKINNTEKTHKRKIQHKSYEYDNNTLPEEIWFSSQHITSHYNITRPSLLLPVSTFAASKASQSCKERGVRSEMR